MFEGCMLSIVLVVGPFETQFDIAGDNGSEIYRALSEVPQTQVRGMEWLITHMPPEDLRTLSAEFLLTNCDLAYEAWREAPWSGDITEEMFFDTILPYANVNERRDDWRGDFRGKFLEIVKDAKSPTQATVLLNQQLFEMVGVRYSTDRPKADQSPYESIDAGMASCTGLSILLIDACRSVGVPARFAGTPLWYNETGNHNWVEIWDDGWHHTGGAEPTGDRVDIAWFDSSASKATKGHPLHAIYAVTWNESDKHFPLVWLPDVKTYGAIDVTDRYAPIQKKEMGIPIRIVAYDSDGRRLSKKVLVLDSGGEIVFEGATNTDDADANDHLTASLQQGKAYTVIAGTFAESIVVSEETILVFEPRPMSKFDASMYASQLWRTRAFEIRESRTQEMESKIIEYEGKVMPFWYTKYGDAAFGELSLWISMHGGGGAPSEINSSQWENQKKLYTPENCIYVAPRAPTDTWNLWHQSHIDPMFERLIENMIVFEGVDPNKVYIIGYSAGGDGVFQLAPRMADKLAAAGMMAGHPNETLPDGLRNIGFALHVGSEDDAYDRNTIGVEWKSKLAMLQEADPDGYAHQAVVHDGKGHWMDREETMALPWMSKFTRNPNPKKVVWVQDDVLHDQLYWLGVDTPKARTKIVASIEGQIVTIHESAIEQITVYLNDAMLDLDKPVSLQYGGKIISTANIPRLPAVIEETLRDPKDYYTASLRFRLPKF